MQGKRGESESEVKWKEGENGQGGSNETEGRKAAVKVTETEKQGVNSELRGYFPTICPFLRFKDRKHLIFLLQK